MDNKHTKMNKKQIEEKFESVTIYPSGKNSVSEDEDGRLVYQKPISGKELLVRGGVGLAGFLTVVGTVGKGDVDTSFVYSAKDVLIGMAGMAAFAGSVAGKENIKNIGKALVELAKDETDIMKKRFQFASNNFKSSNAKLSKKIKDFAKNLTESRNNEPFEIRRARKDGKEGSEVSYQNLAAFLNKEKGL